MLSSVYKFTTNYLWNTWPFLSVSFNFLLHCRLLSVYGCAVVVVLSSFTPLLFTSLRPRFFFIRYIVGNTETDFIYRCVSFAYFPLVLLRFLFSCYERIYVRRARIDFEQNFEMSNNFFLWPDSWKYYFVIINYT